MHLINFRDGSLNHKLILLRVEAFRKQLGLGSSVLRSKYVIRQSLLVSCTCSSLVLHKVFVLIYYISRRSIFTESICLQIELGFNLIMSANPFHDQTRAHSVSSNSHVSNCLHGTNHYLPATTASLLVSSSLLTGRCRVFRSGKVILRDVQIFDWRMVPCM